MARTCAKQQPHGKHRKLFVGRTLEVGDATLQRSEFHGLGSIICRVLYQQLEEEQRRLQLLFEWRNQPAASDAAAVEIGGNTFCYQEKGTKQPSSSKANHHSKHRHPAESQNRSNRDRKAEHDAETSGFHFKLNVLEQIVQEELQKTLARTDKRIETDLNELIERRQEIVIEFLERTGGKS